MRAHDTVWPSGDESNGPWATETAAAQSPRATTPTSAKAICTECGAPYCGGGGGGVAASSETKCAIATMPIIVSAAR